MASQNFPEFCLHEIQLIHMKTNSNDGRCGIVQISVNVVVSRTLGKDKICQWTRIFFDKLRVEIEDSFNGHGINRCDEKFISHSILRLRDG